MFDILIVGGGPAGLTAALYCARAGKKVLVCEREALGGQIVFSPMVDNYPALPHVSGQVLAGQLVEQVEALGVSMEFVSVSAIEKQNDGFCLHTDGGEFTGKAVILATGVKHRPLGLPGESDLIGCGVSYCAVCDGAFYQDGVVAVVGGGDTALRSAQFLAGICKQVHLIHRRDTFRAEAMLVRQVESCPNVILHKSTQVTSLEQSDGTLTGVVLNGTEALPLDGLFISIGQESDNAPFASLVPLDDGGYFAVGEATATPCPGVFAAGDCRCKQVRQLTTAMADGTVAALAACRYLENL